LISRLTNQDYIAIRSTLHALDNRDFYCDDCLSKYEGRRDADEMSKRARELKGCETVKNSVIHTVSSLTGKESILFRTCIGNFFDHSVIPLLEMEKQYQKGVLPYPGSLSEQPYKIIEAFRVIEHYRYEKLERDRKAREQKEKRRGRQ
jgi:hypothetical protein